MKWFILLFTTMLSACAHSPKCGNPQGARIILSGTNSCQVRIRQVTIGSELKIPQSLKGTTLSEFTLDWVEPNLENGSIELGHFVLIPATKVGPP
ncbi:MAG: hypothetical protein AB7K41_04730 [Bdellovibrionales bacterium]